MALDWRNVTDAAGDPRRDAYGLPPIVARIDPYLNRAVLTGFVDFEDGAAKRTWFSMLIELKHVTAKQFARGDWQAHAAVPAGWRGWMKIPAWYADPPAGLDGTYWLTARVTDEFFRQLHDPDSALSRCVLRFGFGWSPDRGDLLCDGDPAPDPAPAARRWQPGDPVIVGVIDDGIAFAHRRFRRADGSSRVEHFWDQRERQGDGPIDASSWKKAAPVPFGVELDAGAPDGIDARLRRASGAARAAVGPIAAGLLDEDRLYRDAGQREVGRRARHGTHVMDIACGAAPDDATAPSIVAVQLPRPVALDTTGHLLPTHVMEGLRYILDRADRMGGAVRADGPVDPDATDPRVPVVVNLSYGTIAGPQDGSSLLEQAMDELITQRTAAGHPFAIVMGAGNHLLARAHATVSLGLREEAILEWRVPADHPGSAFMEIWLPMPSLDVPQPEIEVSLLAPVEATNAAQAVRRGRVWECVETSPRPGGSPGDAVIATVDYRTAGLHMNPEVMSFWCDRDMVLLSVSPTRRSGGLRASAPSGTWRVLVRNVGRPCTIDAWIQRNDAPFGFTRRGVPSRFEDPAYVVHDRIGRLVETDPAVPLGPVRRRSTLNALATGHRTLVVGAARRNAARMGDRPASYASSGPGFAMQPAGAPDRWGPDAAAVADDGAAHRGVIGAGTRSAGAVALNGSSVAAPLATRAVAQTMSKGWPADRPALAGLVEVQAQALADLQRIGRGVIDLRVPGRVERFGRFRPDKP